LKRVILHWTAGASTPSATDFRAYHYLFDKDGIRYDGHFRPEDNLKCLKGAYAAHCGGGNTGSIGVAACGMSKLIRKSTKNADILRKMDDKCLCEADLQVEEWLNPLTRVQIEAMCAWIAKLCLKYGIEISPKTVMTHAEFGLRHPKTSSSGKIDINYLPFAPKIGLGKGFESYEFKIWEVGNWLRRKVKWYRARI